MLFAETPSILKLAETFLRSRENTLLIPRLS
jgi:hypothetical protein